MGGERRRPWKFITGDIDLIATTNTDGTALTDQQHVAALKRLSREIQAQHPESATGVKDDKFWFKAKESYLTNDGECCLVQIGPDGAARAVEFNPGLGDIEHATKASYRLEFDGG